MLVRIISAVTLLFSIISSPGLSAQTAVTQNDINRVKSEIELLKQDIEIKEAELRVMELQIARQASTHASTQKPASKPSPPKAAPSPPTPAPAAPARIATTPAPAQAPRRAEIDPAPYEDAIVGRTSIFRMTSSAKWLALDEKRVVYWALDDEAYILNLAQTCPGLLDTKKLRLENFSTRVRSGKDNVVFDDQHCLIETISVLGGGAIPKPPRQ